MASVDPNPTGPDVPLKTWLSSLVPFAVILAAWLACEHYRSYALTRDRDARLARERENSAHATAESGYRISPVADEDSRELREEKRAFARSVLAMLFLWFPANLTVFLALTFQLEDLTLDRAGHMWAYVVATAVSFVPFYSTIRLSISSSRVLLGARLDETMDMAFQLLDLVVAPSLVIVIILVADPQAIHNAGYRHWGFVAHYAVFQALVFYPHRADVTRMLNNQDRPSAVSFQRYV